ncbi:MAG TPA: DEAD/DEAH box helicase [Microbacterium sp.]|nr:DEAD/DEAH box helicase [Microbacterium sp.]
MTNILLTEAHVEALFSEEDARDGREVAAALPVRVLRAETGRTLSAALVSVGSLTVEVEIDDAGDVRLWCAHCGAGRCAHGAAAILALAEHDEPFGVGAIARPRARRSEPAPEAWERTLRGLLRPSADPGRADPPGDVGLLIDVRDHAPGAPAGQGVAVRPAVRGKGGSWVRGEVTWRSIADQDPHDPRWRALAEIEAAYAGRHNFPASAERLRGATRRGTFAIDDWGAPEWIRLDAVPARGLWDILLSGYNAGLELIADDRTQTPITVSQVAAEAVVNLRITGGRLRVDARIVDRERGDDEARYLPIGAPTVAVARLGGRAGPVAELLPLAAPTTAEYDRLRASGPLSIPAVRIGDFESDFLPTLRDVAPLVSTDGTFDVPEAPLPQLVLAIRHADPVARLFWDWEYEPGARRDGAAERDLLARIEQAAGSFAHLLGRGRGDRVFPARDLDRDQTVEFLAHVLPAIRGIDQLRVEAHDEVPSYTFATERPEITIGADPSGEDWLELKIIVTVQGEPVSTSELITALSRGQNYLRLLSGTVFALTDPRFGRLRDVLTEAKALADQPPTSPGIPRVQLDLWQDLAEVGVLDRQTHAWLDSMRALGDQTIERRTPPESFRATLRDYQADGFSWLDFLRRNCLGGLLADDMGLGKTVQVLAALDAARADEPGARFLVVAPTSVVGHWLAEARRFAPELGAVAITETSRKRGSDVAAAAGEARLVITSYAILRLDAPQFHAAGFRVLVLDEAQQVKNASSKGYAAARLVGAPTTFVVTGTPLENNLLELFALTTLAAPGLFGARSHFREHFQAPIERDANATKLERLRARVAPFLLRRTKEQVAPELPPKTEQVLEIPLHPTHQRAYERRFRREQQKLLGLLDDVRKNQVQILASLTRLRREALHPAFGDGSGPSAKLDALGELLDEIVADGHRALVFSQFTEFLGLAAQVAEERGIRYSYLDGSTTTPARQRMIDRFETGSDPVFFLSLKAGGTGLNLTAADYCILLDPWWNPAAEAQAIDRTHRIGQTRPVMIYRLISAGTIEQKVLDLQDRKRRLFDDVLEGSGAAPLTADDFRELLA